MFPRVRDEGTDEQEAHNEDEDEDDGEGEGQDARAPDGIHTDQSQP